MMMMTLLLLPTAWPSAWPTASPAASSTVRVTNTTLLTRVPRIMTHDSGSGYLPDRGVVNRWTKTQGIPMDKQLACGARAFDARPLRTRDGKTVWHHGGVAVNYTYAQTLRDIIAWLHSDGRTELVLIHVSDCEGDGCVSSVEDETRAANVSLLTSCDAIAGLTYGEAKAKGALPGGAAGSLLVLTGSGGSQGTSCCDTHYDSSLECATLLARNGTSIPAPSVDDRGEGGALSPLVDGCWKSDASHPKFIDRMLKQLDDFINHHHAPRASGARFFSQAQALWQEGADSVVIGTLRNSSLLRDEYESGLNALLAQQVRARRWPTLGYLEVNHVCDGGPELLKAIRETYF